MAIFVTCGDQNSGFALAQKVLSRAGVADAEKSREHGLLPAELTRRICDAYKVDPNESGQFAQLAPGQIWQALTVDMALANLEQPVWGWSDPNSIHLLEFWRDFDPAFQFVLVYASPEYALAQQLEKHVGADPDDGWMEAALAGWSAYNDALLRFYLQNRDRALLVNAETILDSPADFLKACRDRFDTELNQVNDLDLMDSQPQAMAVWSAAHLLEDSPERLSLYQELESASDLPHGTSPDTDLAARAIKDHHAMQQRLQSLTAERDELRAEKTILVDEIEELRRRIDESASALAAEQNGKKALQDRIAELEAELSRDGKDSAELISLKSKLKQGEEENKLLSLQLQQVQEELENYFHKYQELRNTPTAATSANKVRASSGIPKASSDEAANSTEVDLRQVIDGENWYYAERDGRWAGPDTISTLRLPAMTRGSYRVTLDIADAIAPDVLRGMQVSVNGTPLQISLKSLGKIDGRLGSLKKIYVTQYKRDQMFPVRASGQLEIDDEKAGKPLRMELKFPKVISPAERGYADSRRLAIRLRSVHINQSGAAAG